jgi:hypothetical protein
MEPAVAVGYLFDQAAHALYAQVDPCPGPAAAGTVSR